ncbi:MAG TPA: carboxymuconolactone decarboxylase family protein [Thermomicrobiales bacterium]|nr:carboxymuconolactone decarboxylase family protein [Thermomicrobiales bacterium]HRA33105.1 carboxymuconolactone decarboxylase family protein [Thermomicrobiales bacterium]
MATLRYVEEHDADERVSAAYDDIKAGFGNGQVPNVYKVLGNNATILEAAVEHRHRVMEEGTLDPTAKELLAWATVTLLNNRFGIQIHTARLKRLGFSDAEVLEALGVLQYFAGISVVINGLDMGDDVNENIKRFLKNEE